MVGRTIRVAVLTATAFGVLATAVAVSSTLNKPKPLLADADIPGVDPAAALRAIRVPTALVEPSDLGCEEGWSGFANPRGGYELCYPRGWGFTTLDAGGPLRTLAGTQLGAVRLLSEDAFPWRAGTPTTKLIAERGIAEVQISVIPDPRPNAIDTGDCVPSEQLGQAKMCTQRIDRRTGNPSPEGEITELFAELVPTPDAPDTLVVRARFTGTLKRDTLVRIVAQMRRSKREV